MRGINRNQYGTEPVAAGLLAGLLVLLLAAIAIDLGGCAHAQNINPQEVARRYDAAVQITAACPDGSGYYGSGTAVSRDRILTAAHIAVGRPGCILMAEDSAGGVYMVRPLVVMEDFDIASLELVSPTEALPHWTPAFGPPPRPGDSLCALTAFPRRQHKCGEALLYEDPPGDLGVSFVVEPGNSGSGVYDARGRLVAVVTHLFHCDNGQYCGGKVGTLRDRVRLLFP